jgi:hypothetical protein
MYEHPNTIAISSIFAKYKNPNQIDFGLDKFESKANLMSNEVTAQLLTTKPYNHVPKNKDEGTALCEIYYDLC